MTTKLLLSESDIKTAIQQYVRSQGYICHSVAMEVDQNEDYYGNKTGYVVRAAAVAELKPSPSSHSSLAHQIAMLERPLSPGQVQQDR